MVAQHGSNPKSMMPVQVALARRWWHDIPMGLFYVPVGVAILGLMARYRSIKAPLMANPGLEKGGLFPRSKQDFFALFEDNSKLLPASAKLTQDASDEQLRHIFADFIKQVGHTPKRFVLKPDDGIQGKDIHFLEDLEALQKFWQSFARGKGNWLLQEYVDGLEAAVFYNQRHSDQPGEIISMTLKWGFPVTGDGSSSLAHLVDMSQGDAATRARVKKTNRDQLDRVLAKGEPLDLISVRNHHLGATFQDVSAYITPALTRAVCDELDDIDGFQYGRLDIRVPDFAALLNGSGIKVLEANALYSEPVHAYDPKYGLRDAYGIFIDHWHRAIKTGLVNIAKSE